MVFLYLVQVILSLMILNEALSHDPDRMALSNDSEYDEVWDAIPESVNVILARFICGMIMHVTL